LYFRIKVYGAFDIALVIYKYMIDGIEESPESTHLCPVYYAGSGKGYSGQPEKGDVQYLYFPTGEDRDRYVIGCVDAGTEKMEQLDRQEREENAGLAPETQAAEAELPDTKSWGTPGNRRMAVNREGVSFANGGKGRLKVRSGGVYVWAKGEMTLKSEDIAGEGQKITAEAGSYVWLGSGSSGIALLPDQVQISAPNVYMESPLSLMHKTADGERLEELFKQYEDAKKSISPPILTEEGKTIARDGYDDILYSDAMYYYFQDNVLDKVEGYGTGHDEPIPTLYEQWLDEVYGRSAMGRFWDNIVSIGTLQALLDIGGIVNDKCDAVNLGIYLLRGKPEEAFWSDIMVIPLIGSGLGLFKKYRKAAAGIGDLTAVIKSDDVVTDLILTYRAGERSAELLSEIGPLTEKTLRDMKYSSGGWGLSQGIFYHDLLVTVRIVDNAGDVIEVMKIGKNGKKVVQGGNKSPSEIAKSWQGSGKYPGIDDYTDVIVNRGTILYRGEPNGTGYFTTLDSIEKSGRDATTIFQGLQVEKNPKYGYRGEMQGYVFNEDVMCAYGIAKANPQYGKGGLKQYFIPNVQELIEEGILVPVHNIKLHK